MDTKLKKLISQAKRKFKIEYPNSKAEAESYSPATIVLLGDHTHYNDGILILAIVDFFSVAEVSSNDDGSINILVQSPEVNANENADSQSELTLKCGNLYLGPLISLLRSKGFIKSGFNLLLFSNIPQSIGMGFVASNQMTFISSLNNLFHLGLTLPEITKLCIESEKNYLGKMANPAHYYALLNAENGFLLKVDLRFGKVEKIPVVSKDYHFVVFDNRLEIPNPKEICNKRIEECQIGVQALRLYIWGIKNLRDVTLDFLARHVYTIPKIIYKRILFTVSEKNRAESAIDKLKADNISALGELLYQSNHGLRNDYEIGNERIDKIIEYCQQSKQILGAKVISCSNFESVLCLMKSKSSSKICNEIQFKYHKDFNKELFCYKLNLFDGYLNVTKITE